MTLYGSALFLHIISAILLVGGTAWLHVAVGFVRRSSTVAAAQAHVAYIAAVNKALMPIAMLTLAPAIYLAFAGDWWGAGWPVVSLVLFSVAGVTAGTVVDPATAKLVERIQAVPDGPMTPQIGASLADPRLTMATWVLAGADLAIVALMTNKPGYVGSVAVATVGLLIGTALGVRENRHAAAPAAPTAGAAPA